LAEQAWSINDYYMEKNLITRGTQRVIPCGLDSAIFPARVANHSAGFGVGHIITAITDMYELVNPQHPQRLQVITRPTSIFQVTRNSLKNVGLLNAYVVLPMWKKGM